MACRAEPAYGEYYGGSGLYVLSPTIRMVEKQNSVAHDVTPGNCPSGRSVTVVINNQDMKIIRITTGTSTSPCQMLRLFELTFLSHDGLTVNNGADLPGSDKKIETTATKFTSF